MYHTIIAAGNLGRDPELRYTPNGQPVCNFSLATSRKYKNKDGILVSITNWFRVSVWGPMAENCNLYLRKGSKVLVEGQLVPDSETGGPKVFAKNDGTYGAAYEITASNVRFLTSKSDNGQVEEPELANSDTVEF